MNRIVQLDFLRIFANFARCFIHAAVPYMVTFAPVWSINEQNGAWFFDFSVFELHLFVMELFFVLSGFMFAMQLQKKTVLQIISDRLRRILVPFVLGLVVFVPVIIAFFYLNKLQNYSWLQAEAMKNAYLGGWLFASNHFFPMGHLWFLYYLLIFYAFVLAFRFGLPKPFHAIFGLPIKYFIAVAMAASVAAMYAMPRWIVDSPLGLRPELPSLVHYFSFFLLGIGIYKAELWANFMTKNYKLFLGIGIVLGLVALAPQLYFTKTELSYYFYIKMAAVLSATSATYFLVMGIWGFFAQIKAQTSPLVRYLSDASYSIYLTNMPTVMAVQLCLMPLNIGFYLKFIIALVLAFVLNIGFYHFLGRNNVLKKLGNKLNFPSKNPKKYAND